MRHLPPLLLACALAGAARPAPAADLMPVDVALVLVDDVSRSIDDSEFDLQKKGYAQAFQDPQVLAAIHGGANGAIAVAYVEFAGENEVSTVLDWQVIRDADSARTFVTKLVAAQRSNWGRTAISAGMDQAAQLLAESGLKAARLVMDVCGDGTNNAGREVTTARDDALKAGIVINGLAIVNEHPAVWTYAHVQPSGGLARYYRENVTGGPGSFVMEVRDFRNFGEAVTRKLVSEIASVAGTRPAL